MSTLSNTDKEKAIGGNIEFPASPMLEASISDHNYYHQIFDSNTAIMLVIDPTNGQIVEGNQAACRFYGYDSATLSTKFIQEINTLSDAEIKLEMQRAKRSEKTHFNFQHRLASGEIREVEVFSGPIQAYGKTLLYSIVHDITPLKQAENALRESEQKYRHVIENIGVAICVIQNGQLAFANSVCAEWLGFSLEQSLPVPEEFYRNPLCQTILESHFELMDGTRTSHNWEASLSEPPQAERWAMFQSLQISWKGAPASLTIAHDITKRKKAELALRESEERYRQLFEAESDAVFLIDNTTGQILEANSAAEAMYGYSREELLALKNSHLSAEPEETQRVTRTTPPDFEKVVPILLRWHRKKDGTIFPVEITGRFFQWKGRGVHIAAIRDITFRRQAEEKILAQQKLLEEANARLKTLAIKDPLTELYNRRAFDERLTQEIAHAIRQATPLSIVLVDIDFFKAYNDTFGHPAGDEILQQLARLLEKYSRADDFVARYRGEEFVIILPHTGCEGAIQFADRCRKAIQKTHWPRKAITASFGVSTMEGSPHAVKTGHELVTEADLALYHSKERGRNLVSHLKMLPTKDL
ncbi:MAG: hypothetical protein Fur0022_34110 [Anaerolineales bacterium]